MYSLPELSQRLMWYRVPADAIVLAEKSATTARAVRHAIQSLPINGIRSVWHHPDDSLLKLAHVSEHDGRVLDSWKAAMSPLCDRVTSGTDTDVPGAGWAKLFERPLAARFLTEKSSESPLASALSQVTGYKPSFIPGTRNALVGTLAGGALGAGLGYGTGWLGEKILPQKWKRGRLRRTLAILGGLAGATPGAVGMYSNYRAGRPFYQHAPLPKPGQDLAKMTPEERFSRADELGIDEPDPNAFKRWDEQSYSNYKASSMTGWDGGDWPAINVPAFTRRVWSDPLLRPHEQAAAAGLVQGASAVRGGSRYVTPMDVGRIAAGMGSGFLSGAMVGKVLGTLTGMAPQTQERLKNVGLWAGIVKTVVPMVFGG